MGELIRRGSRTEIACEPTTSPPVAALNSATALSGNNNHPVEPLR
jgi:hypothetical protein